MFVSYASCTGALPSGSTTLRARARLLLPRRRACDGMEWWGVRLGLRHAPPLPGWADGICWYSAACRPGPLTRRHARTRPHDTESGRHSGPYLRFPDPIPALLSPLRLAGPSARRGAVACTLHPAARRERPAAHRRAGLQCGAAHGGAGARLLRVLRLPRDLALRRGLALRQPRGAQGTEGPLPAGRPAGACAACGGSPLRAGLDRDVRACEREDAGMFTALAVAVPPASSAGAGSVC